MTQTTLATTDPCVSIYICPACEERYGWQLEVPAWTPLTTVEQELAHHDAEVHLGALIGLSADAQMRAGQRMASRVAAEVGPPNRAAAEAFLGSDLGAERFWAGR